MHRISDLKQYLRDHRTAWASRFLESASSREQIHTLFSNLAGVWCSKDEIGNARSDFQCMVFHLIAFWLLPVSLTPWLGIPEVRERSYFSQFTDVSLKRCTLSTNFPQYGLQSSSLKSTTQCPTTPPNGHFRKKKSDMLDSNSPEVLLYFHNMTASNRPHEF